MASYGEVWKARVQLMRPGNGAMAALGVFVGAWLLDPTQTQLLATVPAAVAALCITSFGNVLNDLRDQEVDAKAHPERPLPSGAITPQSARLFAALLLAFGLWEAALAAGQRTLWFAVVNTILLVTYELRLKRAGLPGNVAVGALVASTFAFGAITVEPDWRLWGMPLALAAMAFLANVARELLKDAQDMSGDVGHRTTLPLQVGVAPTRLLAFFLVQVAVILSAITWWQAPWNPWWGLPLVVAGLGFTVASAGAWVDTRQAQQGLKMAMLVAMIAFVVGPIL